jgi:PLP dependent protein
MLSAPQNSPPTDTLRDRLAAVRQRIAVITQAAAQASGRDVKTVTLLAVTKGQPIAVLQAALALGLRDFGENYTAEALPKIAALQAASPNWHFIGKLQANKTRLIAANFAWVHGVDRLTLAERLSAQRGDAQTPLNVCVQVNIAAEASKGGVTPQGALPLMQAIATLPRLRLRGLMCMLPYKCTAAAQHAAFASMRDLLEQAQRAGLAVDTLSMGMSGDMDAALAEGASIVRIGTALFGARSAAAPLE